MIDKNKVGYDYFFSGVYDILSKDDFTIANAENVFTTSSVRVFKYGQTGGCYWFKGEPHYTKVYKEGSVEVVNIANNHSNDYLSIGLGQSINAFKSEKIGVCGYDNIYYCEKDGIKISFFGINVFGPLEYGVSTEEVCSMFDTLMEEANKNSDIQIASFHWGTEGTEEVNEQQKEIAYYAIDNGADLIIGHGPHRVQEVSSYRNVPIVYSLGNFVYAGVRKNFTNKSMIYTCEFQVDYYTHKIISVKGRTIDTKISGNDEINDYRPVVIPKMIL